jgi:hypothetical protein
MSEEKKQIFLIEFNQSLIVSYFCLFDDGVMIHMIHYEVGYHCIYSYIIFFIVKHRFQVFNSFIHCILEQKKRLKLLNRGQNDGDG